MRHFIELPSIVSYNSTPSDITMEPIEDETILDMWYGKEERDKVLVLQTVAYKTIRVDSIYPARVSGISNITQEGGVSIVAMEYNKLKELIDSALGA